MALPKRQASTASSPARRSVRKRASENGGATLQVALEPSIDHTPLYSNHVEVGHTRHEFSMLFGRVPGKLGAQLFAEATASGTLKIEPDALVLIPPTLMPGLIRALQTQLSKWEARFPQGSTSAGEEQ